MTRPDSVWHAPLVAARLLAPRLRLFTALPILAVTVQTPQGQTTCSLRWGRMEANAPADYLSPLAAGVCPATPRRAGSLLSRALRAVEGCRRVEISTEPASLDAAGRGGVSGSGFEIKPQGAPAAVDLGRDAAESGPQTEMDGFAASEYRSGSSTEGGRRREVDAGRGSP